MRLVRVLLLAAIAASPVAACKGHDDAAPAVVPGAPAGDVTELSGEVSASRDGKTRALKVGDVIAGDDLIKTGADGRVTIVLRHNQVPWSLGPSKEKKVADSAAWVAAKGAAGAAVGDDHSAAAGRHAERSATDSESSAAVATTGAPAPGAPAPAATAPAGKSAATDEKRDMKEEEAVAADQAQQRIEAEKRAMEEKLAAAQQREESAKATADHAPPRSATIGGGGGAHAKCDPGDPLCGLDTDSNSPSSSGDVEGAVDPAIVRRAVQGKSAAFRHCLETKAPKGHGKITITFDVAPAGTVAKATLDASDPSLEPMLDCVRGVATSMRFPTASHTWTVRYPLVFSGSE